VLVVDDDDAIRTLLIAALRREAFKVDGASDGVAALRLTSEFEYAVILLDLMMPRMNGFDFLDAFHATMLRPRSVVVIVSAFDESKMSKLQAEHVHAFIRKPFDVQQLVTIVRELVGVWTAHTAGTPLPATDVESDVTKQKPNTERPN
jgi:DNA-binding response OmpR family regulator